MCANMAATRPTAPDLFRCIEAMKREVSEHRGTHPALLERLTMRADELQSARMALDATISDQADRFIKSGVRSPASLSLCTRVHSIPACFGCRTRFYCTGALVHLPQVDSACRWGRLSVLKRTAKLFQS